MKIFDEQENLPDLLKTFKELTATFNQPLPETVNLLDAVEDLLCDFKSDLTLVDFSPFSTIDMPEENKGEPIVGVVPRVRQPFSRSRNSRDLSSQFGAVSSPNSSTEQNQHSLNNGSVNSSKHATDVPVFKVSASSRFPSGEKPVHVDSDKRIFVAENAFQHEVSDTEQGLINRNFGSHVSDEPSLISALETVGWLTDELLACSSKGDILNHLPSDKAQTLKQKSNEAKQTPPNEIKQFSSGSALESPALACSRTVGTSHGQSRQNSSNTLPQNKLDIVKNKEPAELAISRIDALSDRLLVDNGYKESHGYMRFKRSSRSAVDISDLAPISRAAAEAGTEKKISLKPSSASTENVPQSESFAGFWKLNPPQLDPAGSIDSLITAEQLAELVNDVLVHQARLHGVDLS